MKVKNTRAAAIADKVLRAAIDEETVAIQLELASARKRIVELETVLGNISAVASAAVHSVVAPTTGSAALPGQKLLLPTELKVPPPEPPLEEPLADLADADNMGPGRWA